MRKTGWFPWLYRHPIWSTIGGRIARGIPIAALWLAAAVTAAQVTAPLAQVLTPSTQPVAPNGYSLHESIDVGGHIADITGSEAMYNTLIDIHSGPRVLGETFELHALPSTKNTRSISTAFSDGFGGDPNNYARLNFYKGKLYDFSGMFRRHREHFDYDLLGNPNIPSGLSIPIGSSKTPTGSLAWPQVEQSPFLFNTVHRMTDTSLTLLPLSKFTYRVGYSQNVMEGPSLSPESLSACKMACCKSINATVPTTSMERSIGSR